SNKGTTLKDTDYIGTGMKITFKLGEKTKEYTLVVTGDITGDGKLQNGDLIKLVRYRVELITLEEPYKLAADVNGDGKVADSDIIKLARILVGIK
ncbi:dockerin type I repeat-containing protein, partial [uncultured Fusobacterium sp.]|uniref:dockerin type I repeat-containing protein n=1 Tax=uncultured Fusobacterium sp. TaxID=159267 RepID=UPI00259AE289